MASIERAEWFIGSVDDYRGYFFPLRQHLKMSGGESCRGCMDLFCDYLLYSGESIRSLTAMYHDGFVIQAGADTLSLRHAEFHLP